MATRSRRLLPAVLAAALILPLAAQTHSQQSPVASQQPAVGNQQTPARDTSARPQDAPPTPTARISGRVVAADTGRPIKRARVFINAAEVPGGRGALTDDGGT